MFIRGMALPEEGAATKISVKDIIPLEVARVPMPSLISIKVRLGNNGTDKARSAGNAVRAQTRRNGCPPAAREAEGLLGYSGCDHSGTARQGISRRSRAHLRPRVNRVLAT